MFLRFEEFAKYDVLTRAVVRLSLRSRMSYEYVYVCVEMGHRGSAYCCTTTHNGDGEESGEDGRLRGEWKKQKIHVRERFRNP